MQQWSVSVMMQEIKISNGYIQLWATYLRGLGIDPLSADFLSDVHNQLVLLCAQTNPSADITWEQFRLQGLNRR